MTSARVAAPADAAATASPSPSPSDWFERHAEQQAHLQQVLALLVERISAQTEAMRAAPAASARRRRAPGEDALVPPGEREVQLQKALEEFSDRLLGKTPR
jgi:hypothetical protein